jgi:uncharacterized protein YjbI with pentapeptide repeats
MPNKKHVAILRKGVHVWNAWRDENPDVRPDLSKTNLSKANLSKANLSRANLDEANLRSANLNKAKLTSAVLSEANLSRANLREANLRWANLNHAKLTRADLRRADLSNANIGSAHLNRANLSNAKLIVAGLSFADLSGANLSGAQLIKAVLTGARLRRANLDCADVSLASLHSADLRGAHLSKAILRGTRLTTAKLHGATLREADLSNANVVAADLTSADITGCRIYGISVWGPKLDKRTKQQNLVITRANQPKVTVDDIEVAQFIYLMLNNDKLRNVIDTVTSKTVLILGRFTDKRKAVLDALREELRHRNYLPILFDFEEPARRNLTETITLLARMARFIIADLTDPSSIPQELQAIIPSVRVPVQPVLLEGSPLYSMFKDFDRMDFHWVLPVCEYKQPKQLLATLAKNVIAPAERKARDLEKRRPKAVKPRKASTRKTRSKVPPRQGRRASRRRR